MTCSLKFKFSEYSQRRNFISLQLFQPIIILFQSPPCHLSFTHSIRPRHPTSLQKKKKKDFQMGIPSTLLHSICKCSLYSPILSCFLPLSWKKECSFLSPFQVLWSRIVVSKVSTGPKEGGRLLPILKMFDIDLQLRKH